MSGSVRGPSRDLLAVIDTGATHCQIPEDVLQEIGAERLSEDEVIELPSGRELIRALYAIIVRLDGQAGATTATAGPAGSPTLLSKTALSEMRLGIDAVENRLIREVVRLLAVTNWPTF